jgi:hypothetical protein
MKLAALALSALIGLQGEWVTRDDTGAKVCRLSENVYLGSPISPRGWCDDWQTPKPFMLQPIEGDVLHWIRNIGGGYQLHFEDGWR